MTFPGGLGPMTFEYDLEGVEPDCVNCALHIHTGTTCDDASLVGGHYWNPDSGHDPWHMTGYNSNSSGDAKGEFVVDSGYGYEENDGHAVVVHAQDGSRIGCGVLSHKSSKGSRKNRHYIRL